MPPKEQGAPWVRTRLRTAPVSAVAFGLLVLVTAFLAAVLPRAVEAYETDGLREALAGASPESTVLELKAPQPGLEKPEEARADAVLPQALAAVEGSGRALLPEPLRADPAESAYGVRTGKSLEALDASLPRPDGLPPRFTLLAQSGAAGHATVREGRLPTVGTPVTVDTRVVEGAVTAETARTLRLRTGSELTLAGFPDGPLTVRITGILEPRHPQRSYWSAEPVLRTPALAATGSRPPLYYWEAGVLLAPGAAPALLGGQGEPEKYWRFAPAAGGLTAGDVPALVDGVASLENGPGLVRMRGAAGPTAQLSTGLEQVVDSYTATRDAITPVVAVAAFGIAAVAVVVLVMSAGVAAARRDVELALLRARGGSLRGIAGRLLAETAVPAVPAAASGLLLAVLVVDEARPLPAVLGAGTVALLACAGLPVRAAVAHRRPRAHQERDDLAHARPGGRRTVAELTLLVLAVGSVAALRRRGTAGAGDLLVSAAPVLVGLVAALVLVRLYPLPLRWAAGPAGRLRGVVGFLSLARAGRSPAAVATLPLLALLTALTTAAFGGSVLAGVADARDRAALLETGADVRISTTDNTPLPAGLARAVREVAGVRQVTAVGIEYAAERASDETQSLPVVGVEPDSYAGLARQTGLGGFAAEMLGARGGVLDAVASPEVAERLGRAPHRIVMPGGTVTVRITAVRPRTPAVPEGEFLLVDAAGLKDFGGPSILLAAGAGLDAKALRAAVSGAGSDLSVTLRGEERASLSDSPLQAGAERIYVWAVVAGAGYALLALVLGLLRSAPERAALLARLRTLGLTTRQGRQLLGLEALPLALLAAGGGMAVGWATVGLLAPGIDLDRLALPDASGVTAPGGAALRADVWSLALPAAGAVLLAGAVAVAQAWWAGRRTPITHLRAGDMR
ncbi:membrane protein [Streptomyces violarus]|uniref:Putative ABC transport system permease protein n=1 Tax=Streptomyces violarus TaxID=67380 RepID=A0A7W4ZVM1_9ACTN|nr:MULTISPECIES: ABC transporter permease [Streptomyces]MBB3079363.1 putative ABC transport system permease protein [Streptomyces violarus]WRU01905.1 ABC transporter permease [Streptomyces sp. CGMCC 4.1772]GHD26654.1 membrane protein [Streptomyces violarus]